MCSHILKQALTQGLQARIHHARKRVEDLTYADVC